MAGQYFQVDLAEFGLADVGGERSIRWIFEIDDLLVRPRRHDNLVDPRNGGIVPVLNRTEWVAHRATTRASAIIIEVNLVRMGC